MERFNGNPMSIFFTSVDDEYMQRATGGGSLDRYNNSIKKTLEQV